MSGPEDEPKLRKLREHWRGFAREAPLAAARVGSSDADAAGFYASGARDVAGILDYVGRDVARGRALDVGCGPGRHLGALAKEFEVVDGVDIAPEMLEAARSAGLPANVQLTQTSGAQLPFPDSSFDFVLSFLVLQHISDDRILIANLREISRVMNSDARAFLQFDSRRQSAAVRLTQALPDALLPPIRRRYMRRIGARPPPSVRCLTRSVSLFVADQGPAPRATSYGPLALPNSVLPALPR